MQYSCAYFRDPEHDTLKQAKHNKLIHATSKLQFKNAVLVTSRAEIELGWGGLAVRLARRRVSICAGMKRFTSTPPMGVGARTAGLPAFPTLSSF